VTAPDGSPTLVVTAWEWGKWVGDLSVTFDQRGVITAHQGRVIVVDQSIAQNPAFEARIAELRGPLDALRARPVGTTATRLNGDREDVRSRETNLGNLIADAMLERARPAGGQIAIMNGGGIRASIPAGEVTFGQVLEVLPFGNTLARVDLTGTQVREALENGVSQVETGGGRFPQVAGIRFTFDPAAPVNARVGVIEVRNQAGAWVPISNTATYRIITNDFMLNGGDGYSVFTRGSDRLDLGFILADVVEEAIRAQGSINAETDGRIRIGAFQPAGPIAQGGK
jgi:5'-nucleotidase